MSVWASSGVGILKLTWDEVHEKPTALKAKTHAFSRDYTARPRKLPRQQGGAGGGKPAGGI